MDLKLEILSKLTPGKTFARRYVITGERICGKSHIVCAITKTTYEKVVLKFYKSRRTFENAKKMHERFSQSKRICKLLDVIDDEGGFPLCLVFERGTHTLDQFLEKMEPVPLQKKSILHEILLAIIEMHNHGIVHCDLKPSNIMISENHEWKILDLDNAVPQSKPSGIKTTPRYSAPEIVNAGFKGKKRIATETSADMWSFGVIAYELLTDGGFSRSGAPSETTKHSFCGTAAPPDISAVKEPQGQNLVHKLLRQNPKDRLSAEQATEQAIFKSGDTSSEISAKFGEVTRALNISLSLNRLELSKAIEASLLFSVTVESFKQIEASETSFNEAPGKEVLTACEEHSEDEPCFILRVGKSHRIRVCMVHEPIRSLPVHRIVSIKVINNKEMHVELVTKEQPADDGKREAVAYLDPEIVNLPSLLKETPPIEEMSEKYVPLQLVIAVKMFGDDRLHELNHKIHCKIIAPENKVTPEKFTRKFQNGWEKAPQWMRDVAKGSVLFASIGVKTY